MKTRQCPNCRSPLVPLNTGHLLCRSCKKKYRMPEQGRQAFGQRKTKKSARVKNRAKTTDAKTIPVGLLVGICGSIALALILVVVTGLFFLRQQPKVVLQNNLPENKELQKSSGDGETKTRVPVVKVKASEKNVIEKEKKGIFTLSFLESKIQTDQDIERLPLGPLVFVDKVDQSKFRRRGVTPIAEFVQRKGNWTESPWEPRNLDGIDWKQLLSPYVNTNRNDQKLPKVDQKPTGLKPIAPRQTARFSRLADTDRWQKPPINSTKCRSFRAESIGKARLDKQPSIQNGFSLQFTAGPPKTRVFRIKTKGPFEKDDFQLIWNRMDSETGKKLNDVILDSLPLSDHMNPKLDYAPVVRADISPGNDKICFTRIKGQFSQIAFVDKSGNQLARFMPYGSNVSVDEIVWYSENRFLTLGEGRMTIWNYPELTVLKDYDGGFRSPIAISDDEKWCAVSVGNRLELIDLETDQRLGSCWNPVDGELYDVALSPDGKWMGSTYRMKRGGEKGAYHWAAFGWDLQNQKMGQIPTTSFNQNAEYYRNAEPCVNPRVQFTDSEHLLILGNKPISTNLAKGEFNGSRLVRIKDGLFFGKRSLHNESNIVKSPLQNDQTPFSVCAALPRKADSLKVATAYAATLHSRGFQIGGGGNIVFIAAGSDDKGIVLTSKDNSDKSLITPRVIYQVIGLTKDGKVIDRQQPVGKFLERKSKYFAGTELTDVQFQGLHNWEFPPDYRKAIIDEILASGAGIVPQKKNLEPEDAIILFRIPWANIPRNAPE